MDSELDGRPAAAAAAAANAAFFLGGGAALSVSRSPLASRFLRLSFLVRFERCSPAGVGALGAGEALAACESAVVFGAGAGAGAATVGTGELTPEEAAEEVIAFGADAMM